jgi:hypothetical protein
MESGFQDGPMFTDEYTRSKDRRHAINHEIRVHASSAVAAVPNVEYHIRVARANRPPFPIFEETKLFTTPIVKHRKTVVRE